MAVTYLSRTAALLFLAVFIVCASVNAMSVAPMHLELTTAGSGSHAQFQVRNDAVKPLPVEITFERLGYTESGKRQTFPANDELAVFPMTALIPPGATQTFRIQWVGSPDLARSKSFAVTARQLPVRLPNDGRSRLQVVAAFSAIVNVAPLRGEANLRLVSSMAAKTAQGKPALAVVVENPTNVHALLSNATLQLGNQTVSPENIRSTVGVGVVEPGKRRRFIVPLLRPAAGRVALTYRVKQRR